MMRVVHVTVGKLLAATLLTLCLGLQALEATGRWDRTLPDTGDEAVIVTVVLCIGAALVAARFVRPAVSLSLIRSLILVRPTAFHQSVLSTTAPAVSASPPVSLRI